MEFLKELFGENGINYNDFEAKVKEKGYKIVDLSKGEYVSKKKYDDDVAAANGKSNEWKTKYDSLNNSVQTNDDAFQKKYDDLSLQFSTMKSAKEALEKENTDFKRKDVARGAGISNDRLLNLALYELKDSKDFEADIKTWAEENKSLVGGAAKTFKMNGNPSVGESEDDKFFKAFNKAAGIDPANENK